MEEAIRALGWGSGGGGGQTIGRLRRGSYPKPRALVGTLGNGVLCENCKARQSGRICILPGELGVA